MAGFSHENIRLTLSLGAVEDGACSWIVVNSPGWRRQRWHVWAPRFSARRDRVSLHLTPPDRVFERKVTGWVLDEGASSAGGTVPGARIGLRASGGNGMARKGAGRPEWAIPFGGEFWRRSSPTLSDATPPEDARAVAPPVKVSDAVERVTYAFCQEGANSLPQVRGRGYRASVTDGLEFVASSPEAGEPDTTTRFYTRSIRREIGGGCAKCLASPAWFVAGNTAQALLDAASGLVQHCEAGPAGVEVTWVMSRPPPGQGGMAIEAEMTGIRFSRRSSSGLHFVDGSGIERVKVGLAKAVDRRGRTWPVSIEGEGHSCEPWCPTKPWPRRSSRWRSIRSSAPNSGWISH